MTIKTYELTLKIDVTGNFDYAPVYGSEDIRRVKDVIAVYLGAGKIVGELSIEPRCVAQMQRLSEAAP